MLPWIWALCTHTPEQYFLSAFLNHSEDLPDVPTLEHHNISQTACYCQGDPAITVYIPVQWSCFLGVLPACLQRSQHWLKCNTAKPVWSYSICPQDSDNLWRSNPRPIDTFHCTTVQYLVHHLVPSCSSSSSASNPDLFDQGWRTHRRHLIKDNKGNT